MANWISSKLKAAETILQQIDQQAAESLRKDEKSETHDEVFVTSSKSGSPVSLKDQLRKKTFQGSDYGEGSQRNSIEQKPSYLISGKNLRRPDESQERTSLLSQSLTQEKPTLTANDWTELLSTPNKRTTTSKPHISSGTSMVRGLKKDGKRHGIHSVSDKNRSKKSNGNAVDSKGKPQKQPNKQPSEKEVSSPSDADMENKNASEDIFVKSIQKESEKDVIAAPPPLTDSTRSTCETFTRENLSHVGKRDGHEPRRSAVWGKQVRGEVSGRNPSHGLKRKDSSLSSDESESDYDSDSSTDSDRERQRDERRRRREKKFAEKVATKAAAVIKERENMVARLEGDKQSLENIVEERAKQQAQEENKLEADIKTMRKELEEPTEVENELKRRLDQLTDHLIQKQSQVEALSSEKATLSFRIEAVSRLIEENKGMSATEASSQDVEAGEWELSGSKFKPVFQDKIRSGKKHLGWLVMQLNAIFVSGTVFSRRNPTAKIWALLYLVCLHLWVFYILLSGSSAPSSSELKTGAVISLENFSNSSLQ